MKLKPWGLISWILPRLNINAWHLITSSSFEDRCLALVEWMQARNQLISSSTLLRIANPSSDQWIKAAPTVEQNFVALTGRLASPRHNIINAGLLDSPGPLLSIHSLNNEQAESVILDITTLPKKFFLFALKQLVNSPVVKNLVVTYARAEIYPEAALCENALPPSAMTAYGRIHSVSDLPRMVVGVGYMPLSVEELLDKAKHSKLDFIFPFPPASPAFRRNWALLSMLMPANFPRNTEIHRIHGMDAFEVFERIHAWGRQGHDLDLLPLGPKPHSLGMGMAYMRLDGHAELIYSQPQIYRHDYSSGIARDENGQAIIYAYCLKHQGKQLF